MIGRRLTLAAALLLGIAAFCFWVARRAATGGSPAAVNRASAIVKEKFLGEKPPATADPASEDNPLAAELNAADGSIRHDLEVLNNLFVNFQTNFHAGNPVGENAEIAAALTGANPLHFAFLPKNHSAINARGELCDRWGTPFRFHQLSGTQMEIRSAGPDKKFGTADDVEFAPWPKSPDGL